MIDMNSMRRTKQKKSIPPMKNYTTRYLKMKFVSKNFCCRL
jgi:hypothetical protein